MPYISILQVIARRIGGYGSIFDPWRWYKRLPMEVRVLVDTAGFGPFCSGLIQMRVESLLYRALVERWWDTTDLFHFSLIGEMTLTPYDFMMLTGLRVGVGGLIACDLDIMQWRAAHPQLLGVIPDATSHGYSWFFEYFSDFQPTTLDEVAQYTYSFLMYLHGTTLFTNRKNTVGLFLGALVYLPYVAEYN
ncbi:protein MAIN-LIKE 2-like [Camellia sinensis]|uniref:protein MAIN-LIKE 2-like n=1 Tax=Camellia sinensis TaxID=4442 RepID=UPI001036B816|nr:protein MAIN-LIKE 2-like [Camellia sinensis]